MELKPGYKWTEVGPIPEDWQLKRLGEIGESLIGLTYRPSDVRSDGVLVLRSSNIQNGKLRFDRRDNVSVCVCASLPGTQAGEEAQQTVTQAHAHTNKASGWPFGLDEQRIVPVSILGAGDRAGLINAQFRVSAGHVA